MTLFLISVSNGVSKTGVFCTLYHGVSSINSGRGIINIRKTVELLRQRRKSMVSTKDEYLYCHKALLYYAQDILVKSKSHAPLYLFLTIVVSISSINKWRQRITNTPLL